MKRACTRDRHEARGKSSRQGIGGSCKKHAELEEGYMCARLYIQAGGQNKVASICGGGRVPRSAGKGLESSLAVALP